MTTATHLPSGRSLTVLAAALALTWGASAQARCDKLDGPAVSTVRSTLDAANVNPVLAAENKGEAEIRNAFEKTVAVRKAGSVAQDPADAYLFEPLVRVHREWEGHLIPY